MNSDSVTPVMKRMTTNFDLNDGDTLRLADVHGNVFGEVEKELPTLTPSSIADMTDEELRRLSNLCGGDPWRIRNDGNIMIDDFFFPIPMHIREEIPEHWHRGLPIPHAASGDEARELAADYWNRHGIYPYVAVFMGETEYYYDIRIINLQDAGFFRQAMFKNDVVARVLDPRGWNSYVTENHRNINSVRDIMDLQIILDWNSWGDLFLHRDVTETAEHFVYTLYYVSVDSWVDPTEEGVSTHAVANLMSYTRTVRKSDGLMEFGDRETIKSLQLR
jgi:hypothetical protein